MLSKRFEFYISEGKLENEIPENLKGIFDLFQEDSKIDSAYLEFKKLFLAGEENELMLRFGTTKRDTLTVARIEFKEKRKGKFTKLLALLEEYAKKEGYIQIEVECVNSDEMLNYVKKNGFEEENFGFDIEGTGNWLKEI